MARGQLPKAYLRIDPNLDQHPDALGMLRMICAANRQHPRGYFQPETARAILGRKRLAQFVTLRPGKKRPDLTELPDGRLYLDGWEHWQEGDWTVGERVARLREKRDSGVAEAVTEPLPETVTKPLSPSEALGVKAVETDLRTENNGTGAVAPVAIVQIPKPGLPDWNREFAEDFRETYGGPPSAQLFVQVKAVAKRYGWNRTRPALCDYMAETAVEFLNIPKVLPVRIEAGDRPPQSSRAARQKLRGFNAMAKGGLIDERGLAQGAGGTDGEFSGPGLAGGGTGEARRNLPPGTGGIDR